MFLTSLSGAFKFLAGSAHCPSISVLSLELPLETKQSHVLQSPAIVSLYGTFMEIGKKYLLFHMVDFQRSPFCEEEPHAKT